MKLHCKNGHDRTIENRYTDKYGNTRCRICKNIREKRDYVYKDRKIITHCPKGHELTKENSQIERKEGNVRCKICRKKVRTNANLKQYNLTTDSYNELLKEQDFSCAVCNKPQFKCKRSLSVDHDHVSGKVRGLLCHNCNVGIGNFKEDTELLLKAIEYIKIHN